MSLVVAHQVDAGVSQAEARDLETAAQQRTESQSCRHFLRSKLRFGAERRVIVNYKVLQIKARLRKNADMHRINVDLPSQGCADRSGNARLQTRRTRANQE